MLAFDPSHLVDEHRHAADALSRGGRHPEREVRFVHLGETVCDTAGPGRSTTIGASAIHPWNVA